MCPTHPAPQTAPCTPAATPVPPPSAVASRRQIACAPAARASRAVARGRLPPPPPPQPRSVARAARLRGHSPSGAPEWRQRRSEAATSSEIVPVRSDTTCPSPPMPHSSRPET
eukprot:scaffold60584_cov53-Phaeocystis_antarctica.AAC.11